MITKVAVAKKAIGLLIAIYGVIIVGFFAFWGTVGYVAFHFIHKYWNK